MRLDHTAYDVVEMVLKTCNLHILRNKRSYVLCLSCIFAKSHRQPFIASETEYNFSFELIHSDLWGLSPIKSHNVYSYYVSFVDEFTKFT